MNHIGLVFACFLLGMASPAVDQPISAPIGDGAQREAALPADSEGPWTAVVFGVKGKHSDDYDKPADPRADRELISQILVTADWQAGYVRLASVRTDMMAADGSSGYSTLGEIYRDSGPEGCMEALSRNLDVEAEDYFVVPWKAAADAVNILGGIDIEVKEDERGEFNARLTEVVEATGIGTFVPKKAGLLHMDGVQAVAYMNLDSAYMESTPEEMAARRHLVSEQVLKQAASASLSDVKNLIEIVGPQIDTSLATQDYVTIFGGCRMVKSVEAACIPQTYKQGKGEQAGGIYPDTLEDSAACLNGFLYNNENYECPVSVQEISRDLENADIS